MKISCTQAEKNHLLATLKGAEPCYFCKRYKKSNRCSPCRWTPVEFEWEIEDKDNGYKFVIEKVPLGDNR